MTDPATRAREFVLDTHSGIVESVLQCAGAVADRWDGRVTTDRTNVADALRTELETRGTWARLPDVLAGAVVAAGYSVPAPPVAEPPYVTATSRGPMLRATVPEGRLVVLVQVFEIDRAFDATGTGSRSEGGPQYLRGPTTPVDAVRVRFVR